MTKEVTEKAKNSGLLDDEQERLSVSIPILKPGKKHVPILLRWRLTGVPGFFHDRKLVLTILSNPGSIISIIL